MKIPAIKQLVESYTIEELVKAEEALLEEQPLAIEVDGNDEGEQLTHVMAAIWILQDMEKTGQDFKTSLRSYTQKVRNSIS
jgi:hypothetical protein